MGATRGRRGWLAALGVLLAGCRPAAPPSPWDTVGDRTFLLPTALGTPLEVGLVQPCGPELVISRGTVSLDQPTICLFRARPRGHRWRVFVHHLTAPDHGAVRFELRIRHLGDESTELRAGPNSLGLPHRTPTATWTGPDHGAVGALAMHSFLEARAARDPDVSLGPIDMRPYALGVTVQPHEAWSFIAEFEAAAAVELGLYATRPGSEVDLEAPLAALPKDDAEACRGLFAAADRRVLAAAPLDGLPHYVDLAGPVEGAIGDGLPGEYETRPAANPGNGGVVYEVEVELRNRSPAAARGQLLMTMAGGPGSCSIIAQPERTVRSWSALQLFETARIGSLAVPAGASSPARLAWSLPGGARGPHRLYVWPDDRLPPD